jgi:protein ImuB
MGRRYVSIWFRFLVTDWFTLRQPQLHNKAFVVKASSHGRMVVTAANALAQKQGIDSGMALAMQGQLFLLLKYWMKSPS